MRIDIFSAYLHIFYRLSDRIHQVRLWDIKSFKLMVNGV